LKNRKESCRNSSQTHFPQQFTQITIKPGCRPSLRLKIVSC